MSPIPIRAASWSEPPESQRGTMLRHRAKRGLQRKRRPLAETGSVDFTPCDGLGAWGRKFTTYGPISGVLGIAGGRETRLERIPGLCFGGDGAKIRR